MQETQNETGFEVLEEANAAELGWGIGGGVL